MNDNATAVIAARTPAKVELEAGRRYFWCGCGRSKTQPFCDGSHKGTGLNPIAFIADDDKTAFLCRCKASANTPFCDGAHNRLGAARPGDPVS